MNAIDFVKKTKSGKINISENYKKTISEIKKINKDFNYFLVVDDKQKLKDLKKGRLYGLPVSIKDCICVKDMESKAGSKILEGYKPLFDATVVEKLREEGAIIVGKTNQDVFGFGSFNINVGLSYKTPKNPFDKTRATGGSSGGAGGITQKITLPHVAISESTGGSIVAPASYCGVYGLCPTYGRVSRYGLIDYSNSQDKIGVMSKDIEELALVMQIISGQDSKDSTSIDIPVPNFTTKKHTKFRIAVVEESLGKGVNKEVKNNLKTVLKSLKYDDISMPLTYKYSVQVYYLISITEASTNLAKYCGMRFGVHDELKENYNDYFSKVRSKNFSKEAKRRIILGTFARMSGFRDAYYLRALKVRTLLIEEYKKLFKKYDIIFTPTMPNIAPKFSEISIMSPLENFMMDIFTAGPNLAGLPHLNIPSGFSDKLPTGLLAVTDHFEEHKLIDFARLLKLKK